MSVECTHQSKQTAVMIHKQQATTPNEVNAFELSNLKKAASDAPLGRNNRKTLNGCVDSKQADAKRPLDKMIVQQARHEILDVRVVKGGVDAATVSDFTECVKKIMES